MTDDDDGPSLDDFVQDEGQDYRESKRWEVTQLATKQRDDAAVIVQHPFRETVENDDGEESVVETMGLSVNPATPSGTVTIQNTSSNSNLAERFVAFDVEMIDGIIDALEEVKDRYEGEDVFTCPCCATTYTDPEEMDENEYGLACPECDYLL